MRYISEVVLWNAMSKTVNLEDASSLKVLGGTIRPMFSSETGAENLSFSVGDFEPGEKLVPHIHPESEEVYYVLKGNGTVFLGEDLKEISIKPDMGLFIPAGEIHGVTNTGKGKLLIAFFVAPGKEKLKIFEK